MKSYSDMEYLKLPGWKRFLYSFVCAAVSFPKALVNVLAKAVGAVAKLFSAILAEMQDTAVTFIHGDIKTRVSYFIMGFGSIARGQVLRGILFFLFQAVFVIYMFSGGAHWLLKLHNLGDRGPQVVYDPVYDTFSTQYFDNSFKILLYGAIAVLSIFAYLYTWRQNIRQNKVAQQILAEGKKLKSGREDLRSLVDDNFNKTLLALPVTGIFLFTVLPIVFMILVAFTNYDGMHNGYSNNLFTWVGLNNFNELLSWRSGGVSYAATFGEVLSWTLIWAFFATFTNYFLGMLVAMMINKKGIRIKKFWRTCLVLTVAVPQFISLLYVSKMFANDGLINGFLMRLGWISKPLPFWTDGTWARITVIAINVWVGIPYIMLIATGILMNIPKDLYESARIDGAGPWKQYAKITLPYMLFITGPYLLTSFTGNMNNFNVIYLLTGGAPTSALPSPGGALGETDLLITWLFKLTTYENADYNTASVIGILVFVVVAVISLVVYNIMPSTKNEEDFQ